MAAVLFIVTIPTVAEEKRLKTEFIARRWEQRLDHVDGESAATATATAIRINIPEIQLEYEETASATATIEMPTTPVTTNVAGAQQYGTFPKRRKAADYQRFECMTTAGAMKNQECASVTGSFKEDNGGLEEATDGAPTMRKSWEGLRDILSSTKRKTQKKKDNGIDLDMPGDSCMELVLREILTKFQILNAVWTRDTEGRMHQIIFTIEFNETYENILDKFHEWGIGDREGSTVSVMNCIASKTFARIEEFDLHDDYNREHLNAQKQGAWNRFMNSMRSRLNAAQIVRDVRQDAAITFDFIILLISAAILASFGLIEDSTIFLASSMLISPLMGPIIAAIFGTVIKDKSLRSLGLKNELLGILIATVVGFLFGMVVCTIDERYGIGEGLTSEMLSRCELHSLLVGVFTAIPSGAAAAVGILGGNIGSLVGVAISASLLPPAVNSGLLWALACVYKFFETDVSRYPSVVKTNSYSNNQATELAILGSISMCLTISNVICVYIMGILVLKVKEIAPVISRNNRQFWKHDIKIARDLNKNGFDTDTAIIDEFANLAKEDQKVLGIDCEFLRNIQLEDAAYQNTWSPVGTRHPFETSYEPRRENYSTVHRFERLYSTITQQQHQALKGKSHLFGLMRRPTTGHASETGTYKVLAENLPRCATMPSKVSAEAAVNFVTPDAATISSSTASVSNRTSATNTPTCERKKRKFIVTPAEDPLHMQTSGPDEMDA